MLFIALTLAVSLTPLEQEMKDKALAEQSQDAEERKQFIVEMNAKAKKHHLEPIYDIGLHKTLVELLAGRTSLKALKNKAIEMTDFEDGHFIALQALKEGSAIYTTEALNAVVLMTSYKEAILEGSKLTDLEFGFVRVLGLKKYRTPSGTTKQAIVVEPAW